MNGIVLKTPDNQKGRRWLDERFRDRLDAGRATDPAEAWLRWRAAKLAETIEWAAKFSPWYSLRLEPELVKAVTTDLRGLARAPECSGNDFNRLLTRLPTTAGADLAADPDAFLAVSQDEVEGVVSVPTSGTGGQARRIWSTGADLEETIAFFSYGMRFLAAPGRDRVALAMNPARPGNVADLLGRALARWSNFERAAGSDHCSAAEFPDSPPFLAHGFKSEESAGETLWLRELIKWGPTCLVGVPPQMLALSRHRLAGELARTLKTMLLSGDVADDRLVAELENNLPGCRVYRHYGLTEAGLGGAVECGQRGWPHLRDDLWAEIIELDSGRPVSAPGQTGEITLTPLTRRGLPLIRYRTGDEGRLIPSPCPCGSIMPRLQIFGRLADRFTLPSGRGLRVSDLEAPLAALPFARGYDLKLHLETPEGRAAGPGASSRRCRLSIILAAAPETSESDLRTAAENVLNWLGPDAEGVILAVEAGRGEPPQTANGPSLQASGGKRRLIKTAEPLSGPTFHR